MPEVHTTVRFLIPARGFSAAALLVAVTAAAQTPTPTPTPGGTPSAEPEARYADAIEVVAPPVAEGTRVTREGTLVTSVSAEQMRDLDASDLASALRRLPGLTISRYNPVGSYGGGDGGAVYLRGQGSGRPGAEVSMLFDGIPRFVSVWTHPLLDVFPVEAAERLDVYRSAQPVLLGTMAFGAVDLVPQRAAAGGPSGRLRLAAGSFATRGATVEFGSGGERLDLDLVASRRQSDGHREGAGGRVDSGFGRVGARLSEHWSLRLVGSSADSWADDPGREGLPAPPVRPRFGVADTLLVATVENRYGSSTGHVKLYYEDGSIDWRQWDAARLESFSTLTDYRNTGLRARQTFEPWPGGEVVVGADHDRFGGEVREVRPANQVHFARRTFENTAGYTLVSHRFPGPVEVIPSVGVRYTSSREFGGNWGGQAGLVLRRGGTEVHANLARAFNLPGVWVAVNYEQWGLGDSYRELAAERLDHAEVGVGQVLSPLWRVDLNLFRDRVHDALRFDPPPPPPPSFANLGTYSVLGAEATVTARLSDHVAVFLGGTHLDTDPATVPNAPEWAWVGGANLAFARGWKASVDAEWVDAQEVLNPRYASGPTAVEAYALVNGRLSFAFAVRATPVEVYVAGENLGDSEVEYRPGYPMPGRSWSTGLEVRF